jgi:hypothetical protein
MPSNGPVDPAHPKASTVPDVVTGKVSAVMRVVVQVIPE